jgi:hypothetical protein
MQELKSCEILSHTFESGRMSKDIGKIAIVPLEFDFEGARLTETKAYMTLSGKDVLGIVQSALSELAPSQDPQLIAIKRAVLEEVAQGKLAHALRTAIVGAGKRGGSRSG